MTTELLLADLRRDEGLRLHAYADPKSGAEPYTIGYGHAGKDVSLGMVWTLEEAEATLEHDVAIAEAELDAAIPWWRKLDPVRCDAVCELAFNLGVHKFTTEFPQTLGAIRSESWTAAGHDLAADQWAKDVGPGRSGRIIHMLQFGVRP